MTTNLEKFAAEVRSGADVYLVDSMGGIHALSWTTYCQMPASALGGCRAFANVDGRGRDAAIRVATRIWQRRESQS